MSQLVHKRTSVMTVLPYLRSVGRSRFIAIVLPCIFFATGCTGINQRLSSWSNAVLIKIDEKQDLAGIRNDTREALAKDREEARRAAAERDIQEARIAAERERLEIEFCQANQEALQRRIKENLRQTVESKVAFNVEHGLEVGELEVDVEALKNLIKERETQKRPPPEQYKRPCTCCDAPCGCEGEVTRRHCPRCCRKPCEAEKKCGGEEALTRAEQQPLKQPLRPAEIPMKLPVRLSFGFQQPEMEASRIRRTVPEQFNRPPCDYCAERNGQCDVDCLRRQLQNSGGNPASGKGGETNQADEAPLPPPPVPDVEARRNTDPPMRWYLPENPQKTPSNSTTTLAADSKAKKKSVAYKPANHQR